MNLDPKGRSINPQSVITGSALLIGLGAAIVIAGMVGSGQVRKVIVIFAAVTALAAAPRFYPFLLALAVPTSLLSGPIGYLFRFTPFHLVAGAGLAGWLVANFFTLNRKRAVNRGNLFFVFAVFTLCGILIFHMIRARLDPSGGFGGLRLGVAAVLVVAFLILSFVYNLPEWAWRWLPFLSLIPTGLVTALDLLSLAVPSLIPVIANVYVGESEIRTGAAAVAYAGPLLRIVPFREFGLCLALLGAVNLGVTRLNSFKGLAARALVPLGLGVTLMSGFRGYTVTVFCLIMLAFYVRYRILTIVPIVGLSFCIIFLVVGHGQFLTLPPTVQRALSFLPGNWDASMKMDADEGYDFREELWHRYWDSFDESIVLFGKGHEVDLAPGAVNARSLNEDAFFQFFIDSQNYHNGFLSTLDMTGIFGVCALAFINCYIIYLCLAIFRRDPRMPAYVLWVMLFCISPWPRFWYTGFLNSQLPFLLMPAIGLTMVWRYRYNCGAGQTGVSKTSIAIDSEHLQRPAFV